MRIFLMMALAGGLWLAAAAAPAVDMGRYSLGLGVGQIYGELGTNVEYRMTDVISLSGGLGLNGDNNWFLGARAYLKPAGTARTRSRVTIGVATHEENGRQPVQALLAVGGTWSNSGNDYSGFDIDITTQGRISLGYHF